MSLILKENRDCGICCLKDFMIDEVGVFSISFNDVGNPFDQNVLSIELFAFDCYQG